MGWMEHKTMLIGTDPSFAAERRYRAGACDDAQIRIRRVLALLEAARGAVIPGPAAGPPPHGPARSCRVARSDQMIEMASVLGMTDSESQIGNLPTGVSDRISLTPAKTSRNASP